jgi:hypothetical protein
VLIEIPKASATNSSFSADGNWIAYGSTEETGYRQVYVHPFPTTGLKFRVPGTGSNHHPLWSPSKTEKRLFYMTDTEQGKGQIISVDFKTEGSRFIAGKPVPLPIDQIASNGPRAYDITPDGKYFIVMESPFSTDAAKASSESFNVILNWFDELKQRVPVR